MKKITVKRKSRLLVIITVAAVIAVILGALYVWYQVYRIEKGILDVCATQQDAYVQLVLDQINLKENRDDEEIIRDILGTLDSSSNKYWTFSKDHDMLFVKDVIETNRYKGLTAVSYYDSESAREFLDSLKIDRVIHKDITINDKEYVASGVAFLYGGESYRLCLLTNRDIILHNNEFMGARIEMSILVGAVLLLFLVTAMLFAKKHEKLEGSIEEKDESIKELQEMVGQLNEMLCQKEHYDTRYQLWNIEAIKDFVEKMNKRGIETVVAVKVHCINEGGKKAFLDKATILLDKKILRFALSEDDVLLLYIKNDEEGAMSSLKLLLNHATVLKGVETLVLGNTNMDEYVQKLTIEVQNGYKDI